MTKEQSQNQDLVRCFKCGKTGPIKYVGLMTRDKVKELQAFYFGKGITVWHQSV